MTHEDVRGAAIAVGCYVCYAALWNRSATLKYGRVTRLKTKPAEEYGLRREATATIGVVSVDQTSSWVGDGKPPIVCWEPQAGGREVTLGFLDRLLVVPPELVPAEAREAIDHLARGR